MEIEQKKKTWHEEAKELGNEMEEYAKKYKCKKCNEYYCSHMLKAMGSKFKKRCDNQMNKLADAIFA